MPHLGRHPSQLLERWSQRGIRTAAARHLSGMSGKGQARLALLVFVALLGAGLTLGAMHTPLVASLTAKPALAQPAP
jgi:hypothetical protein